MRKTVLDLGSTSL